MAKTYDTYKDSGIAWIGEIPGEWEVCRYKNICNIQSGFPFNSSKFSAQKGFPLIRIRDITSGKIETYYDGEYTEEYVVKKGDLIIGMDGDFNVRLWQNEDGLLNQRCCRLYEKKCANKSFLFYTLPMALRHINDLAYATTVKHLSNNDIYNSSLAFPPLSVQQSISSFLDTKCGEIDSLISIQEEMISELLAYKQSVITEAVTKGLDKKAKMKNSGVEWIGDIPEEWEVCSIKYQIKFINGFAFDSNCFQQKGEMPVFRIGDIIEDKISNEANVYVNKQNALNNYEVHKGDILLAMSGATTGKVGIVKEQIGYINQRVGIIRSNIQPWIFYNLKTNIFSEYILLKAIGSAQPNISTENFKNYKIPLPPLPVQQAIATYLDEKTTQIDSLIALKQSKIESLKEYKKSIIYEYVTGKKRV